MSTPTPAPQTEPQSDPTPTPAAHGGTSQPTAEKLLTQAEVDAIVSDRLARQQRAIEANAAKAKADADAASLAEQGKFKELAEAAAQERDALKAAMAERDHRDLQRVVATAHKLPESLASRLQGETREELEADAKELAKLIATPEPPPTPGNRAGPRPQPGPSVDERTEAYQRAQPRYQAI